MVYQRGQAWVIWSGTAFVLPVIICTPGSSQSDFGAGMNRHKAACPDANRQDGGGSMFKEVATVLAANTDFTLGFGLEGLEMLSVR